MDSQQDLIAQRKEKLITLLKRIPFLPYIILGIIILIGYTIRIKNLPLLRDSVTGQYIPLALDPYLFLRYAETILAQGSLPAVDTLRYFPLGYPTGAESTLATYFSVYLYKFLHFFNPELTLQYVNNIYPPIAFAIGIIFFFLLVKELFNVRVALLASAFLTVIPTYLYRTLAGFSDKEALAMILFFAALYFYVKSWKAISNKKAYLFAGFSGLFTGLMSLTWGGSVFLYLTVGGHILIALALDRLTRREFYAYTLWLAILLLAFMTKPERFPLDVILLSTTTGILFVAWGSALIHYLLYERKLTKLHTKTEGKIPEGYTSLAITFLLGILGALIITGPSFIIARLKELYVSLVEPFGTSRWALTVAENHQPYITDWIGQLGIVFIWLFIIGSILLFYKMLTFLRTTSFARKTLTTLYTLFIISFIFSRYSPNSPLNGTSNLSLLLYIGSFAFFGLMILYLFYRAYRKDQDLYEDIRNIPKVYTVSLIFFILMLVAARSASRLLFIFSPFISIFAAYTFDFAYEWTKKKAATIKKATNKKILWAISLGIMFLILFNPIGATPQNPDVPFSKGVLLNYYEGVSTAAQYTGPNYNGQWQIAMQWVRENTPEDAVFGHWWDYGYWVQYGGRRATLVDGGNARGAEGSGAINHFIGRHVLTGTSDQEALELLAAYNTTHLLMISDEIGKYPAYSSIGADANYDRYGYIPTFMLDPNQIREGRSGETILLYTGGAGLDHDIEYEGKIYPQASSGIAALQLPVTLLNNGTTQEVGQPSIIIVSSGTQTTIPLNCLYAEGQLITYETGLDACIRIIPVFQTPTEANPLGAALYLSPVVSKSRVSHLYLFDEESPHFTKVYDDSNQLPLSIFQGRLIGPIKIWEISYPDNLTIPDYYYTETLPDPNVTVVR